MKKTKDEITGLSVYEQYLKGAIDKEVYLKIRKKNAAIINSNINTSSNTTQR